LDGYAYTPAKKAPLEAWCKCLTGAERKLLRLSRGMHLPYKCYRGFTRRYYGRSLAGECGLYASEACAIVLRFSPHYVCDQLVTVIGDLRADRFRQLPRNSTSRDQRERAHLEARMSGRDSLQRFKPTLNAQQSRKSNYRLTTRRLKVTADTSCLLIELELQFVRLIVLRYQIERNRQLFRRQLNMHVLLSPIQSNSPL